MSDGRYPTHSQVPHAQYAENYSRHAYAPSNTANGTTPRSPRQTALYGHHGVARHDAQGQAGQHSSYPNVYPMPQRSMTPSLAGHPQLGYAQNASRPRSSSITMQSSPPTQYPHGQPPPANGNSTHHRTQSQLHSTDYTNGQPNPHYPNYHAHMHAASYRSSTPAPSSQAGHYYGHPSNLMDAQVPASPQRPFPCDMCALSFNRQHDLKRHKETHTGDRPFLCNGGCGKTFTRKDALKRHQLVKGCGRTED